MDDFHYKLIISYDGTRYSGWQVQPNGISIQEVLQEKMSIILREKAHVTGSGRTDAGVHALGQTAHFKTKIRIDPYRFLHSLNALLPADIRVHSVEEVSPGFHPRYDAKGKIYSYHLNLNRTVSPFRRLYTLHVHDKIDVDLLKQAAQCFIGTHDFTSFANEAHKGSAAEDAVRTIHRLDVIFEDEGYLRLEFEGNGFLYKMVRNIVGALLDVARGKIPLDKLPQILLAKDRKLAGQTAPAHGLFLVKVIY